MLTKKLDPFIVEYMSMYFDRSLIYYTLSSLYANMLPTDPTRNIPRKRKKRPETLKWFVQSISNM